MDRIGIIEQIRRNDRLLSIPQVLSKVLEEVGKENFSPDSLAKVILNDPNLTSRILHLVNSPFYHRLAEIKTVNQAISVMGVTTVKCLALSTSIFHPDKVSAESGIDAKAFFQYELAVAAAAEQTAKAVKYRSPEEAMIAGLLQDIGVLFFLHHYPREYRRVAQRKDKSCTLAEAEREVFSIDHTEVGGYLAEAWKLPEYIRAAIREHHETAMVGEQQTLSNIVRMAVLLTNDHFSGYEPRIEQRLEDINRVSRGLGIEKKTLDEISS
ncbi:MAG TPA: HDOD domain-containing protein, partial [candidate division Zixibacteria bacterium]|nr:HDOD domain-containing protein [candidate division Zixibacteria bacterium]